VRKWQGGAGEAEAPQLDPLVPTSSHSSTHVYPRARKHGFCLPFSRRRFRARRARRRVGGSRQARLILCLPG
jgi:hypothetical protein